MYALFRTSFVVLAGAVLFGQTIDKSLTFEVASIKPAAMPTPNGRGMMYMRPPSGGPGSKDPGRINYPFITLKSLIMNAYDVKDYQVSGPPYLDSERFEVTAKMPPDTTQEQFRVMLQNLLAERFKLTVHKDTKELPMYSLVVAKGGPKLTESAEAPPVKEGEDPGALPPPPPLGQIKMGPDGFPILPAPLLGGGRGGMFFMGMPGKMRLSAQKQTMKDLADNLSSRLARPVADETGLTRKYDFALTFSTEGLNMPMMPGPPPPPPGGGGGAVAVTGGEGGRGPGQTEAEAPPDIFRAIQSQLGLKLDAKKGPVTMIVVDHVEKAPTEN
jgi:uncharacterized protein (TIGR03435 family)